MRAMWTWNTTATVLKRVGAYLVILYLVPLVVLTSLSLAHSSNGYCRTDANMTMFYASGRAAVATRPCTNVLRTDGACIVDNNNRCRTGLLESVDILDGAIAAVIAGFVVGWAVGICGFTLECCIRHRNSSRGEPAYDDIDNSTNITVSHFYTLLPVVSLACIAMLAAVAMTPGKNGFCRVFKDPITDDRATIYAPTTDVTHPSRLCLNNLDHNGWCVYMQSGHCRSGYRYRYAYWLGVMHVAAPSLLLAVAIAIVMLVRMWRMRASSTASS